MPRKAKTQDSNPYESIRGMWESAFVSQFLRLFQDKFDFVSLNTQEFEDALVDAECLLVADICARILRYLTGDADIEISNFELHLKRLLTDKCSDVRSLYDGRTAWADLTAEEKLGLLKWLVDHVYQEKEEDLGEYLDDNFAPDDMRGICAGQDAFNNVYWYLDDLRLYRENSVKKPNKKDWECVCLTFADWQSFLKQFRKTSNSQERELYTYLNDELFPIIEGQLKSVHTRNCKNNLCADNSKLLLKERQGIVKMIKESKEKGELGGATIKTEPEVDSTCPEEGDMFSESTTTIKTECDSASVGVTDKKAEPGIPCGASSSANNQNDTGAMTVTTTTTTSNNSKNQQLANATTALADSELQQVNSSLSEDQPDDCGKKAIKEEALTPLADPSSQLVDEKPVVPAMCFPVSMGPVGAPCTPIQHLPSNMIQKQPSTMEAQYMQQQSQIFVFSTQMANRAAEAVLQGQYQTIIAYHCSQPGTKRFLEKHPLKIQQFTRQNPAAWLNSLAQMKQNRAAGPGPMKGGMMGGPMLNDHYGANNMNQNPSWLMNPMSQQMGMGNMGAMGPASWQHQHNQQGSPLGPNVGMPMTGQLGSPMSTPMNNGMGGGGSGGGGGGGGLGGPMPQNQQHFPVAMGHNPAQHQHHQHQYSMMAQQGMQPNSPMMAVGMNQQPSLAAGVKVPDENLTPQQRQHREEQLAIIRNMHQLLFPDQHQGPPTGDCSAMGHSQMGQANLNMGNMMQQSGPPVMCGPQHVQQSPGMMMGQGQSNMMSPANQAGPPIGMMNPSQGNMYYQNSVGMVSPGHQQAGGGGGGGGPYPPGSPMAMQHGVPPRMMMQQQSNMTPASMAAQMEWQKLQQQFYEERRRKQHQHQQGNSQQIIGLPSGPGPGGGPGPGVRVAGPPPPYHQAQRGGGVVPGPLSSPTPMSPNPSASSVLSLPSPRMSSGLSSPADASRPFSVPGNPRLPHPSPGSMHSTPMNSPNPRPLNPSNPGTPAPGTSMSSPGVPRKQNSQDASGSGLQASGPEYSPLSQGSQTPCANLVSNAQPQPDVGHPTAEGMFGRTLQSYAQSNQQRQQQNSQPMSQQQQQQPSATNPALSPQKEPNLMPVPSPQQIQYLNAFEGQELTIQKQPNTGLREQSNILSPDSSVPPGNVDGSGMLPTGCHDGHQTSQQPCTPQSQQSHQQQQGRMSAGLQCPTSEGYSSPSSVSGDQLPRFPTPNSQGPNMGLETLQRFPTPTAGAMPGGPDGVQRHVSHNPLEAMAHRFTGPEGAMGQRFPGPRAASVQQQQQQNVGGMADGLGGPRFPGMEAGVPARFSGSGGRSSVPSPSFSQSPVPMGQKMNAYARMSPPKLGGPEMGVQGRLSPLGPIVHGQRLSHFDPITSMAQMSQSLAAANEMGVQGPSSGPPSTHQHQHPPPLQGNPGAGHQAPGNMMAANMTSMNVCSMQVSGMNGSGGQPNVVNFQTSMQSMQGVQQGMGMGGGGGGNGAHGGGGGNGGVHPAMMNQMGQNMGPQTVNNTYVNATMSIQQLNIQNVTTSTYNPSLQVQTVNPQHQGPGGPMMQQQQQQQQQQHQHQYQPPGANTVSSSVTMNPIMHSSVSPKSAMSIMPHGASGNGGSNAQRLGPQQQQQQQQQQHQQQQHHHHHQQQQQQQQHHHHHLHGQQAFQHQQRMMTPSPNPGHGGPMTRIGVPGGGTPAGGGGGAGGVPGPSMPYNGANVQVKASAPNTIQYLPARPQAAASAPQRPPSLDFLQRYTNPHGNMDAKVPTHNLQYFPHVNHNQGPGMSMNVSPAHMNVVGAGPGPGPGPGPNVVMGHHGSPAGPTGPMQNPQGMVQRGGPNVSQLIRGPGPMHPSHQQMMAAGQMYGMCNSGPGDAAAAAAAAAAAMYGQGMQGQMGVGGPHQMYANKAQMQGQGGPMGVVQMSDATQPLPPSMGQAPAGFVKQSPFVGPTTADPNYAQQFHNFQQQLYATNTRGSQQQQQQQMNAQNACSMASGQTFFGPK